jgi:hypothetical protein
MFRGIAGSLSCLESSFEDGQIFEAYVSPHGHLKPLAVKSNK